MIPGKLPNTSTSNSLFALYKILTVRIKQEAFDTVPIKVRRIQEIQQLLFLSFGYGGHGRIRGRRGRDGDGDSGGPCGDGGRGGSGAGGGNGDHVPLVKKIPLMKTSSQS